MESFGDVGGGRCFGSSVEGSGDCDHHRVDRCWTWAEDDSLRNIVSMQKRAASEVD